MRLVFILCLALTSSAYANPGDLGHRAGEVIISFEGKATRPEKDPVRAELKGRRIKGWGRINAELRHIEGLSVEEAIERYRNHPKVEYIEPNYIVEAVGLPNDPNIGQLWGMDNTGQTGGAHSLVGQNAAGDHFREGPEAQGPSGHAPRPGSSGLFILDGKERDTCSGQGEVA